MEGKASIRVTRPTALYRGGSLPCARRPPNRRCLPLACFAPGCRPICHRAHVPPEHAPRCAPDSRLITEGAPEFVRTRYRHHRGSRHPPHLNACAMLGTASRAQTAAATPHHSYVVPLPVWHSPP